MAPGLHFFLQEHLIVLPIIVKNNFGYHTILWNCSCVLNFSSCIYTFLLLFLVINFGSFMLPEMLLISLRKVFFIKRNHAKWLLFQKKNFAFCQKIEVLWRKYSLLFLLLICPRCSDLMFINFPDCSYFQVWVKNVSYQCS